MADNKNHLVREYEHREEAWQDLINFGFEEHEAQGHIIKLHEYYRKKTKELKDCEELGIVDQELKFMTEIFETGIFLHHFDLFNIYNDYIPEDWSNFSESKKKEYFINKQQNKIDYSFSIYTEQIKNRIEQIKNTPEKQLVIFNEISNIETLFSTALINDIKYKPSLLRRAIVWLNELKLSVANEQHNLKPEFKKIRTNMTVEQLAFLFKILKELKLIDTSDGIPNLSKAISSIFETQRTIDISAKAIKNHYDIPTENAIKFWEDQKQPIQSIVNKYKENNSK